LEYEITTYGLARSSRSGAQVVYTSAALRRIQMATKEAWRRNWASQQEVEAYAADLTQRKDEART
jgi:hypothetical protein